MIGNFLCYCREKRFPEKKEVVNFAKNNKQKEKNE